MPQNISFLFPTWILLWLCIFGFASLILGYRRVAISLLAPPAIYWFAFPLKTAVVENTPLWVQILASFILVVFVLRAIFHIIFGKEIASQAIGQIVATTITGSVGGLRSIPRRFASSFKRRR